MGVPAPRVSVLRVVGHALLYFVLVFGIGFLLGPVRVLWLAPRVGERSAELIEAPLMLAAITLASHWIERRWCTGWNKGAILGLGACAAVCVLAADLGVGVLLRGMSVAQVFLARDPVSGAVYYVLVAIMALAPFIWNLRRAGS